MTAAERILRDWTDETPRGGFDVDGSRIDLRDGVQCARDYYEACRLLMEIIQAYYENTESREEAAGALTWLKKHGLAILNTSEHVKYPDNGELHLLWDKLPKESP